MTGWLQWIAVLVAIMVGAPRISAQVTHFQPADSAMVDSLVPEEFRKQKELGPFSATFGRETKFLSYLDGLVTGNEDRSFTKRFDINFIATPSYTREGSFGIGGGATGLYRTDRTDSIMQPSDVTLIGNATLNGLFSVRTNGNHHFPGRKLRLSYKLEYNYTPLDFWGISREACGVNDKIKFTSHSLNWFSDLVFLVRKPFYIGASLDFIYNKILKIDDISYLEGQKKDYFFTSLGLSFQFDTRDFIPNPRRGMYLELEASVRPRVFGTFNRTLFHYALTYNYYQRLWPRSILAFDIYACSTSEQSPWVLREALGSGGVRMRGYYAGRYRDNDMLSGQMELRQHVFSRFGLAVWGGYGTVFHTWRQFRWRDMLPNYGVGLRIEVKHNMNGRIDYGFGRGTSGLVFSIGEAF